MGFIAPKERKHLSADALFGLLRNGFAKVPDHRSDDSDIIVIAGIEGTRKPILFDIFINTAFYWEQYSVTFDTVQDKTLADS